MKHNWKMKNKLIIFMITFILILINCIGTTFSEDTVDKAQEDVKFEVVEYSDVYKEWLNLPEEEREKTIPPTMYGVPYVPSTSIFKPFFAPSLLASSYNLKNSISMTVRNQMQTGCCWAFAATRALETNISLTTGRTSATYSPRHMEYATAKTFTDGTNPNAYNREVGDGGLNQFALSYYSSGLGPVLESDMPFQNSEAKVPISNINKTVQKQVKEYVYFPNIFKSRSGNTVTYTDAYNRTLTQTQVNAIRTQIKEHITKYGAVTMHFNSNNRFFNSSMLATYNNDSTTYNDHAVVIVGWDDNYSKNNFQNSTGVLPINNGAWICLNSWGTGYHDGGYFYISYEDRLCEAYNAGIVSSSDVEYDNLYQYDILAANRQLAFNTSHIYVANVFSRKGTGNEYISEIGISSLGNSTVDVYVSASGDLNINNATLVKSDFVVPAGYKTVEFSDIKLTGSQFAVILDYKGSDSQTIVPVEAPTSSWWGTATANAGESMYSSDGVTWDDITTQSAGANTNFVIKAFTTTSTTVQDTEAPKVTFSPNTNSTYAKSRSTTVSVTDNIGVNSSSLKYVWTNSGTTRPSDSLFTKSFTNNSSVSISSGSGDFYLWVKAEDTSGNKTYAHSGVFKLDNGTPTAPTIAATVASNVYTNQDVTVTISGGSSLSGIKKYQYSLDGGTTWLDANSTNKVLLSNTGIYNIKARAVNNVNTAGTASAVYVVKINKEGINISFSKNGSTSYAKSVSTKVDATTVGNITAMRYLWSKQGSGITSADIKTSFTNGTTLTKNTGSGNWYLWIYAQDSLGVETVQKSNVFKLDNDTPIAPTVTASIANGSYSNNSVTVTISGSSSTSGIKNYQYSLDNGQNWTDVDKTNSFRLTTSGAYNIIARAVNNVGTVGNVSSVYMVGINKEGIIISFSKDGDSTYAKSASTAVSAKTMGTVTTMKYLWSKQATGITKANINASMSNDATVTKDDGSGDWYLWVYAQDSTGAELVKRSNVFKLDNDIPTAPQINATSSDGMMLGNGAYAKGDVTVDISGSASTSGIRGYQYSIDDGRTWENLDGSNTFNITSSGVYNIKAKAVNNVGTVGTESSVYTVGINKEGIIIDFVPDGNTTYVKSVSTKVNARTIGKITALKYLWSKQDAGIINININTDFANGDTITKNTESGDWYLWIYATDDTGYEVVQRSKAFKLDNDIPASPTIVQKPSDTKEVMTLELSGPESLSGIQKYQYTLDDGKTWKDVEISNDGIVNSAKIVFDKIGDYNVKVRAVNKLGTIGETSENVAVKIRTKIPEIKFNPNGNDVYQKSQSTTIDVSSSFDIVEQSMKYIWSQKDSGITSIDFDDDAQNYKNGATLTKDIDSGKWYLWACAKNSAGDTTVKRSEAFSLDNDPPVIEGAENGVIYDRTVKINVHDEYSTVKTDFMKDGKSFSYKLGEEISENGEYTVKAVDSLGNENNIKFTINRQAPKVTFLPNGSTTYKKKQDTKVTVMDESGIKEDSLKYLWSSSDKTPTEKDFEEKFNNKDTIENDSDTGKYYLWIYAEDNEGNKVIAKSDAFYLDNTVPTKPKIKGDVPNGGTTDKKTTIHIDGGEAESKVHYEYSLDNGKTWKEVKNNEVPIDGTGEVTVLVEAIGETGLRSEPQKYTVTIKQNSNNNGNSGNNGNTGNQGNSGNTGNNGNNGSNGTSSRGNSGTSGNSGGTQTDTKSQGALQSTKYSGEIPNTGLGFDDVFSTLDIVSIILSIGIVISFTMGIISMKKNKDE